MELNRDLGSHSQKQHDTNNRSLRQGEETEKRRAHRSVAWGTQTLSAQKRSERIWGPVRGRLLEIREGENVKE